MKNCMCKMDDFCQKDENDCNINKKIKNELENKLNDYKKECSNNIK